MTEHYAEDYSLIMGLVDLVPVILFALAGCILIKVLFNELKKPFAALLCSGVTLGLTAGTFKAIWKILLSLNICDFYPFDVMFMPTQALSLVLMGVGLLSMLFDKNFRSSRVNVVALPILAIVLAGSPAPLVNGNVAFIALLIIGELMIAVSLSFLAVKNKNCLCLALFIVFAIFLIIMGAMKPLSTKMGFSVTAANWIEESINIVAQASLLLGCYFLNKKGFFAYRENIN